LRALVLGASGQLGAELVRLASIRYHPLRHWKDAVADWAKNP
jgi:dTDP-4-dehydrorhamnose reductase